MYLYMYIYMYIITVYIHTDTYRHCIYAYIFCMHDSQKLYDGFGKLTLNTFGSSGALALWLLCLEELHANVTWQPELELGSWCRRNDSSTMCSTINIQHYIFCMDDGDDDEGAGGGGDI